ncbi:hypothetical protein [Martelella sp. HB161492]|uniref:hypothetical protein n=1 Tax=Martelella sp. HB161492 TaxID=2720726 RepID=UPI0015916BCE|nr:hypothetical protein [Martelella sp. HB161492]
MQISRSEPEIKITLPQRNTALDGPPDHTKVPFHRIGPKPRNHRRQSLPRLTRACDIEAEHRPEPAAEIAMAVDDTHENALYNEKKSNLSHPYERASVSR